MPKPGNVPTNFVDHTGKVYNGITAIAIDRNDPRYKHGTVWSFRCWCGVLFSNHISLIKRGVVKSCGCNMLLSGEDNRSFKDLTGQRFNHLVAIKFTRRVKSARGMRTLWLFKCDCGKEIERTVWNIVRGSTKSCGCMKGELCSARKILPGFGEVFNRAYSSHVHAAKDRSYVTHLTKEQYIEIVKKPCVYCGMFSRRKTQRGQRAKGKKALFDKQVESVDANSVDRLNNEHYYDLTNSVPACFTCQTMKGTLTAERFFNKCREILAYQERTPLKV